MKVRVTISENDNLEVWRLFHKYNALLDIIAYLHEENSEYSDFLNKKLDEAVYLYLDLENAKSKCNIKYRPEGKQCNNYTFDFENQEMVFEVQE
jgi:hypothetical protein